MRIYGHYDKSEEDKTRCIAEVSDVNGWVYYQCQRKRGNGPTGEYCKQHAKMIDKNPQAVYVPKNEVCLPEEE